MKSRLLLLACLTLQASILGVSSENILFLMPFASKSHKNVYEPLIKALADKGHNITVASPIAPAKPYPNVYEMVAVPLEQLMQSFPDPFEQRKKSKFSTSNFNSSMVYELCENSFLNKEFMALKDQKFDLIFVNFWNDCFAGLVHVIGAPFVMGTTLATPGITAEFVGNRFPSSFVPALMMEYTDEMTFPERLKNTVFELFIKTYFQYNYKYLQEIYRKHLGAELPGIMEIQKNVSMILSNSYFPLNYPRPLLPDIVEVGGMHCRPSKPLPKELDDFLSGAEHGFIYFSMGSILKTEQMPEEMKRTFLNVFGRLKQRVLWKWNSGEMANLPKNVMLSKWLPQQDILGHPKIRVFMTHGGLLSTQEASYHGVPLLGIPVFADQDLNMKQATQNGYAVVLEILDLTEELLEDKLKTLLIDPSYAVKAKKLSSILQDQPQSPLERAVFWVEYVMRHKGAPHLRSAARKLNYFQYHSLDVVAFLLTVMALIVALLVSCCKLCYRKTCGRLVSPSTKKTKKKNQ